MRFILLYTLITTTSFCYAGKDEVQCLLKKLGHQDICLLAEAKKKLLEIKRVAIDESKHKNGIKKLDTPSAVFNSFFADMPVVSWQEAASILYLAKVAQDDRETESIARVVIFFMIGIITINMDSSHLKRFSGKYRDINHYRNCISEKRNKFYNFCNYLYDLKPDVYMTWLANLHEFEKPCFSIFGFSE